MRGPFLQQLETPYLGPGFASSHKQEVSLPEPSVPRVERFAVEFVLRLSESELFTHLDTTHKQNRGRDTWLIEFEWEGEPHRAELDLHAGNMLVDWRSDSIRVEVSEDGYTVEDAVYATPEAAAQELVDRIEERAADLE